MRKIGFIGAFDKSNFIIYVAKLLEQLGYKILVVDTTSGKYKKFNRYKCWRYNHIKK